MRRADVGTKKGEPEGSPSTASQISELEVKLQSELNVAVFVRVSGNHALLRRDRIERRHVSVVCGHVVVAVVERVVEFATELEVEAFSQFERLRHYDVESPVRGTVPRVALCRSYATAAVLPQIVGSGSAAENLLVRHFQGVANAHDTSIGVRRQREV